MHKSIIDWPNFSNMRQEYDCHITMTKALITTTVHHRLDLESMSNGSQIEVES